MDTVQMKEMARRFGADLVGVAPVERFAGAAPENHPLSIFPQAKSVIVVGRVIPRGSLRVLEESAKRGGSFGSFGFQTLEDNLLARTTYDLGIWIESQGYEAVPLFGYDVEAAGKLTVATPVAAGKPAPNVQVDWKHAAAAAGLGAVGRHGLFLTPEYGVRQRFAVLVSDFAFAGDAVATPSFCDGCAACVTACPMEALSGTEERCDAACRRCRTGAIVTNEGRFKTVERIGAACGRACFATLEAKGMLTKAFRQPFREGAAQ